MKHERAWSMGFGRLNGLDDTSLMIFYWVFLVLGEFDSLYDLTTTYLHYLLAGKGFGFMPIMGVWDWELGIGCIDWEMFSFFLSFEVEPVG
jgi:hypothetical protein